MVGPGELEHRHHIDGEAREGERDVDAEIASAPTAARPKQICILVFVADKQLSRGRDDLGLDQLVVAGQAMPPLAEADPSTEYQSGNAHSHAAAMRNGAIDRAKACIDIGVARAAPHAHASVGVPDTDLVHQRHIDQESAGGRVARIRMAAGADREWHAVRRSPQEGASYVVSRSAAGDAHRESRGIVEVPWSRDLGEVWVFL
jgi:hypothetical protein